MFNDNLKEFMGKVKMINKDLSKYNDEEKGIMFMLNTIKLVSNVEYIELSKEEYEKGKFEKQIDDLDYEIIEVERPVPKNIITKKDEDKYTIVNSKVKVRRVWKATNGLGLKQCFTNKDEAYKLADEINNKVLEYLK